MFCKFCQNYFFFAFVSAILSIKSLKLIAQVVSCLIESNAKPLKRPCVIVLRKNLLITFSFEKRLFRACRCNRNCQNNKRAVHTFGKLTAKD